jgi:hypothetical protein
MSAEHSVFHQESRFDVLILLPTYAVLRRDAAVCHESYVGFLHDDNQIDVEVVGVYSVDYDRLIVL